MDELKRLIEEINAAKKEQAEKNMSTDIFSIYWVLKDGDIPESEDKANGMREILNEYPHWRVTEEHERKVKNAVNKIFIKSKIEVKKSVEMATKIINILKGADH